MSKISAPIKTLRQHHKRTAKDKACVEIKNYYRPKRTLHSVPENIEVVYMKTKDKNKGNKRNFTRRSQENKADEKELVGDSKRTKSSSIKSVSKEIGPLKSKKNPSSKFAAAQSSVVAKKVESKRSSDMRSRGSSTASSDLDIVMDNSIAANSIIVLDSSVDSTIHNDVYGFDALHTDDSTDYEEDDCYKPYWSLYKNRIAIVIDQTNIKSMIVDQLFSSKPETVTSSEIFPASTPVARRRSTAIWNTPPRYSMLPKY